MNIVILGAGQVGSELSAILASDHDVTLIDLKQEKLQKISDHHDLKTICGNACYPKTLEQAEIETADLAIAMTQYELQLQWQRQFEFVHRWDRLGIYLSLIHI